MPRRHRKIKRYTQVRQYTVLLLPILLLGYWLLARTYLGIIEIIRAYNDLL